MAKIRCFHNALAALLSKNKPLSGNSPAPTFAPQRKRQKPTKPSQSKTYGVITLDPAIYLTQP